MDILDRCLQKLLGRQKKEKAAGRDNLGEEQVAVEISGVGAYSVKTLRAMTMWHKAMKRITIIDKAVSWVDTIDVTVSLPSAYQLEYNTDIIAKMKAIPLLSVQAENLDLIGKTALGDNTINTLMLRLFGKRTDVMLVDTSIAGNVMNGYLPFQSMHSILSTVDNQKILVPVICGKNHWCSIMINLILKDVSINDPMKSSYLTGVPALAEKVVTLLPGYGPRIYRVHPYESDLGVQVDSYNCGMFMLIAFEMFTRDRKSVV